MSHLLHRSDVVLLEVALYGNASNVRLGREVVAAEEERPHREVGELAVVGGPDHARERVAVLLVRDCGAGLGEPGHVHAARLEGPSRCAVAAREAAPAVLVRVDEDRDTVLGGGAPGWTFEAC